MFAGWKEGVVLLKTSTEHSLETLVLKEIMENVGVMLAYFDVDFNFLAVNSAYAKSSGYNPEDLIGKNYFV